MSSTLDVLQRCIREYCGKDFHEARQLVDAIHAYSHAHDDDLNRDPRIRVAAARLDKALDDRQKIIEKAMKNIKSRAKRKAKGAPRGLHS